MDPIFWLVLFVVLVLFEILTLGLTTIWFAGGALAAFFVSLAGEGGMLQLVFFLFISMMLLLFTKPIAVKYINQNRTRTNIDALIGEQARVTIDIDNRLGKGQAIVHGQEWLACSAEDKQIPAGTVVEIVQIKGVTLFVKAK